MLRLHPLSVAELGIKTNKEFRNLLALGGFPEPYLSGSTTQARRWSREYRTRLIREEVTFLERIQDLGNLDSRVWFASLLEAGFAAVVPLDRHAGQRFTAIPAYAVGLLEVQCVGAVDFDTGNVRGHCAHSATGARPLLTLSPSSARKVQKVNDDIIVKAPNVRKA